MSATVEEEEPKDAKLVKSILDLMGVQKYEPRAVNQFMDLWYRYVVDVLGDAQMYSEHAGEQVIDCEETLLDLAKWRNSTALLKTIGGPGVALPPEHDFLIVPTYQLDIPGLFPFAEDDMDVHDEEWSKPDADRESSGSQPTHPQKSDQDGRRVSFSIGAKRPRS